MRPWADRGHPGRASNAQSPSIDPKHPAIGDGAANRQPLISKSLESTRSPWPSHPVAKRICLPLGREVLTSIVVSVGVESSPPRRKLMDAIVKPLRRSPWSVSPPTFSLAIKSGCVFFANTNEFNVLPASQGSKITLPSHLPCVRTSTRVEFTEIS